MHVRAASVQIQPGRMQEAIDSYNGSMLSAIEAQKGIQGAYLNPPAAIASAKRKCR